MNGDIRARAYSSSALLVRREDGRGGVGIRGGAVLINIFGGILRCDVLAGGVIAAVKELSVT